jgi:hypothetical protein
MERGGGSRWPRDKKKRRGGDRHTTTVGLARGRQQPDSGGNGRLAELVQNRGGVGSPTGGPRAIVQGDGIKFDSKFEFKRYQMKFKSFQALTDSKRTFLGSKKIEIKYGCEGFEESNNFLYRNFSRFETYFKWKFREFCRFRI